MRNDQKAYEVAAKLMTMLRAEGLSFGTASMALAVAAECHRQEFGAAAGPYWTVFRQAADDAFGHPILRQPKRNPRRAS